MGELEGIQWQDPLYPSQGSTGNCNVATELSNRNAAQQVLAEALDSVSLPAKGAADNAGCRSTTINISTIYAFFRADP